MPDRDSYDVIIIGAGISGLVCGCYLAKAGMKVLIVEQHYKPGGYCTSFKRGEFIFDAAAHSFGSYREGGNFRNILQEIGVDKIVKISRFNPSDIVITPDLKISFWNDLDMTINELGQAFPREHESIKQYFKYYSTLDSQDQSENIKLKNKTFADILTSFFRDDHLMNTLAFPVLGNGGLPPSLIHAFTGTKIFREFMIDGGYYPEGGMQKLPDALEFIIKQNKGSILYGRRVQKILVENNVAIGVELDDKEIIASKFVVSACDITQTFKKFLDGVVRLEMVSKINNMTPSVSTFTLYMGLNEYFDGLPQEGTNIWYLPHYDLDRMYSQISSGEIDSFGGGGFMLRVSPDKRTILAFCITNYKTDVFWKQNKKQIANDFLSKVEKIIPNLKKHIVYFDAATPYTLYRYTLNNRGANYGWAPLQSQLFDPDCKQKSFLKGLYITGHWTCQTHGIPGVAYLGRSTANLILNSKN